MFCKVFIVWFKGVREGGSYIEGGVYKNSFIYKASSLFPYPKLPQNYPIKQIKKPTLNQLINLLLGYLLQDSHKPIKNGSKPVFFETKTPKPL